MVGRFEVENISLTLYRLYYLKFEYFIQAVGNSALPTVREQG